MQNDHGLIEPVTILASDMYIKGILVGCEKDNHGIIDIRCYNSHQHFQDYYFHPMLSGYRYLVFRR